MRQRDSVKEKIQNTESLKQANIDLEKQNEELQSKLDSRKVSSDTFFLESEVANLKEALKRKDEEEQRIRVKILELEMERASLLKDSRDMGRPLFRDSGDGFRTGAMAKAMLFLIGILAVSMVVYPQGESQRLKTMGFSLSDMANGSQSKLALGNFSEKGRAFRLIKQKAAGKKGKEKVGDGLEGKAFGRLKGSLESDFVEELFE